MTRHNWTEYERDQLRQLYGKMHPGEIGRRLSRTRKAVHQQASKLGLVFDRRAEFGSAFGRFMRARHREGWSDRDIANAWGCNIGTVCKRRHKAGLPSNRHNARHREKNRKARRLQFKAAGVKSLVELRYLAKRIEAVRQERTAA